MREYRVGDSLRQIDWKATARARRLISREYQDEKNQQLVLLLDTGRRLLARDGELSHFDHVLDASLVVSYLALRQGDGVGLLASGGDGAWVPPQRGVGAIDNLLRPILVGRDTRLPDYVVLISTIGGIALVGINGFVIGPLIAALFMAAWTLFRDEQVAQRRAERTERIAARR